MEKYRTEEVWYPTQGGGEMIDACYDRQIGMPLCENSKLVTYIK